MRFVRVCLVLCVLGASAHAEVPTVESFRAVPQYPEPAAGAALTMGAADSNGRIIFWDGDMVYRQEQQDNVQGADFTPSGGGYLGDPSFVAIASNNRRVFLGSGADGTLYSIPDILDGLDFVPGTEIAIPTHFYGVLLSDRYLALDRVRDDLVGAEIVLVDLGVAPPLARMVLQKPAGSAPAALAKSPSGLLYVMNSITRELRWFDDGVLINAFNVSTPVDWSTGTPVGAIGQFLNGGVFGITPDNELIIGGDEGAAGTGGIQWVDPTTTPATVLDTLDPAGTGPAYVVIYNRDLDRVVALDPTVSPPVAWASTDVIPAIPPDSPCEEFDAIDAEFTAFIEQYSPGAMDLDGDTIADTAMLELVELYSCRVNETDALTFATNTAYDDNREAFALETNAGKLASHQRIIPVLLFLNDAMRSAVLGLLSTAGTPLSGTYVTVTCTDTENCLPEFIEDPVARFAVRGTYEPYFGSGDADGDGVTNLTEYENVVNMGGDDFDFAVAAASTELDGTGGIDTGSDSSGMCFIATAAYGTPMAGQLDGLRAFRDSRLLTSAVGAAFVESYYRTSPVMAGWIAERPAARAAARLALYPIVNRSGGVGASLAFAAAALVITSSAARKPRSVQRK